MALFTPETAPLYAAKGGIASGISKRLAEKNRREEIHLADLAATYEGKTLARVRLQWDRLFEAFMAEVEKNQPDASRLERIATAQCRLAELDRQLSGRPMPPVMRAKEARMPRSQAFSAPQASSPGPIAGPTGSVQPEITPDINGNDI